MSFEFVMRYINIILVRTAFKGLKLGFCEIRALLFFSRTKINEVLKILEIYTKYAIFYHFR